MTHYQNLDVWKKSMLLVKGIYTELKFYPKEEMYALTSQTKRAAVSGIYYLLRTIDPKVAVNCQLSTNAYDN